ncbi:MAG: hypothetical protein IKC21_03955, partial [Ruminococcus sp.]|nr:hypothetical protein [Ruminococcus sp.]
YGAKGREKENWHKSRHFPPFFPYGFPLWALLSLSPFSLPLSTFDEGEFLYKKISSLFIRVN